MPVEIRELNIKMSVVPRQEESAESAPNESGQPLKEEIIAECVEQVMEILKMKNER